MVVGPNEVDVQPADAGAHLAVVLHLRTVGIVKNGASEVNAGEGHGDRGRRRINLVRCVVDRIGKGYRHRAIVRIHSERGRVVAGNDLVERHWCAVVVERASSRQAGDRQRHPSAQRAILRIAARERRYLDLGGPARVGLGRSGHGIAVRQLVNAEVLARDAGRANVEGHLCERAGINPADRQAGGGRGRANRPRGGGQPETYVVLVRRNRTKVIAAVRIDRHAGHLLTGAIDQDDVKSTRVRADLRAVPDTEEPAVPASVVRTSVGVIPYSTAQGYDSKGRVHGRHVRELTCGVLHLEEDRYLHRAVHWINRNCARGESAIRVRRNRNAPDGEVPRVVRCAANGDSRGVVRHGGDDVGRHRTLGIGALEVRRRQGDVDGATGVGLAGHIDPLGLRQLLDTEVLGRDARGDQVERGLSQGAGIDPAAEDTGRRWRLSHTSLGRAETNGQIVLVAVQPGERVRAVGVDRHARDDLAVPADQVGIEPAPSGPGFGAGLDVRERPVGTPVGVVPHGAADGERREGHGHARRRGRSLAGGIHRRVGEVHRDRTVVRIHGQQRRSVVGDDLVEGHRGAVVVERAGGRQAGDLEAASAAERAILRIVTREGRNLDLREAAGIGLGRRAHGGGGRELLDAEVLPGGIGRGDGHLEFAVGVAVRHSIGVLAGGDPTAGQDDRGSWLARGTLNSGELQNISGVRGHRGETVGAIDGTHAGAGHHVSARGVQQIDIQSGHGRAQLAVVLHLGTVGVIKDRATQGERKRQRHRPGHRARLPRIINFRVGDHHVHCPVNRIHGDRQGRVSIATRRHGHSSNREGRRGVGRSVDGQGRGVGGERGNPQAGQAAVRISPREQSRRHRHGCDPARIRLAGSGGRPGVGQLVKAEVRVGDVARGHGYRQQPVRRAVAPGPGAHELSGIHPVGRQGRRRHRLAHRARVHAHLHRVVAGRDIDEAVTAIRIHRHGLHDLAAGVHQVRVQGPADARPGSVHGPVGQAVGIVKHRAAHRRRINEPIRNVVDGVAHQGGDGGGVVALRLDGAGPRLALEDRTGGVDRIGRRAGRNYHRPVAVGIRGQNMNAVGAVDHGNRYARDVRLTGILHTIAVEVHIEVAGDNGLQYEPEIVHQVVGGITIGPVGSLAGSAGGFTGRLQGRAEGNRRSGNPVDQDGTSAEGGEFSVVLEVASEGSVGAGYPAELHEAERGARAGHVHYRHVTARRQAVEPVVAVGVGRVGLEEGAGGVTRGIGGIEFYDDVGNARLAAILDAIVDRAATGAVIEEDAVAQAEGHGRAGLEVIRRTIDAGVVRAAGARTAGDQAGDLAEGSAREIPAGRHGVNRPHGGVGEGGLVSRQAIGPGRGKPADGTMKLAGHCGLLSGSDGVTISGGNDARGDKDVRRRVSQRHQCNPHVGGRAEGRGGGNHVIGGHDDAIRNGGRAPGSGNATQGDAAPGEPDVVAIIDQFTVQSRVQVDPEGGRVLVRSGVERGKDAMRNRAADRRVNANLVKAEVVRQVVIKVTGRAVRSLARCHRLAGWLKAVAERHGGARNTIRQDRRRPQSRQPAVILLVAADSRIRGANRTWHQAEQGDARTGHIHHRHVAAGGQAVKPVITVGVRGSGLQQAAGRIARAIRGIEFYDHTGDTRLRAVLDAVVSGATARPVVRKHPVAQAEGPLNPEVRRIHARRG